MTMTEPAQTTDKENTNPTQTMEVSTDKNVDFNAVILHDGPVQKLSDCMAAHSSDLKSELDKILGLNLELNVTKRAQLLVAAWANKESELLDRFIKMDQFKEPAVVAKALQILDTPREARAAGRKLAQLQQATRKPRSHKVSALKEKINNLKGQDQLMNGASASGSFARWVKRWVRDIPAERLEFFLLHFDTALWKALCDTCHLKPDTFQLDYFQKVVFEGSDAAPEGSLVKAAGALTPENLADTLAAHPSLLDCYSYLRQRVDPARVPALAKGVLAEGAPLQDVLWFFEELSCPEVDEAVRRRLEAGEAIEGAASGDRCNYGKLMERLLTFKRRSTSFWELLLPYAEARMAELRRHVAASAGGGTKVAVFGDASASMQVAVNSATIIGSMLCGIFSGEGAAPGSEADLLFFNNKMFRAASVEDGVPRTAAESLQVTEEVRAGCPTAPAAALWPYLSARKRCDLFVVVTDEVENTRCEGMYFADMWERYLKEVNPLAKCVFVSFLRREEKGQMVTAMQRKGLACQQFRLDPSRPDLSKFDSLLAMILVETQSLHSNAKAANNVLSDAIPPAESQEQPKDMFSGLQKGFLTKSTEGKHKNQIT